MDVNYFGVLSLSKAFAPVLAKVSESSIVNVLSFLSLVTLPSAGTYSASKAAGLAASRSIRAELLAQGTQVVVTMPVQVETDMGRSLPEPRLQPLDVVSETLDAVEAGVEEVFPRRTDPHCRSRLRRRPEERTGAHVHPAAGLTAPDGARRKPYLHFSAGARLHNSLSHANNSAMTQSRNIAIWWWAR